MRRPHFRFTVRRLMMTVALVAVVMFVGHLADNTIGTYATSDCRFGVASRPKMTPIATTTFVPEIGWIARAMTLGYLAGAWVFLEWQKKRRLRELVSRSQATYWF